MQALGLRNADAQAGRLCFILDKYRERSMSQAGLTVVAEDALGDDVRALLGDSGVAAVSLSAIDGYAESIRAELGL